MAVMWCHLRRFGCHAEAVGVVHTFSWLSKKPIPLCAQCAYGQGLKLEPLCIPKNHPTERSNDTGAAAAATNAEKPKPDTNAIAFMREIKGSLSG